MTIVPKIRENKWHLYCACAQSLQSCPSLWDPIDYSPPGSSVHGDSPGKNTGVGCHFLLQGIFQPRDRACASYALAGRFFTTSATWEAQYPHRDVDKSVFRVHLPSSLGPVPAFPPPRFLYLFLAAALLPTHQ